MVGPGERVLFNDSALDSVFALVRNSSLLVRGHVGREGLCHIGEQVNHARDEWAVAGLAHHVLIVHASEIGDHFGLKREPFSLVVVLIVEHINDFFVNISNIGVRICESPRHLIVSADNNTWDAWNSGPFDFAVTKLHLSKVPD